MRQHPWSPVSKLALHKTRKGHWKRGKMVVKSASRCRLCGDRKSLTKHHVPPLAAPESARGHKSEVVLLCRPCHSAVHVIWGEGHLWSGPLDADEMVAVLHEGCARLILDQVNRCTMLGARAIGLLAEQ